MSPHDEPYELLLAYHEGRLGADEGRRVEGLVATSDVCRAHLASLHTVDADRTLALRDGRRLGRFGLADATELCLTAARDIAAVAAGLAGKGRGPIAGWSRKEWQQHLARCPFCSRVLQAEEGRREAEALGLGGPLLRDWLLAPHYAEPLRRAAERLRSDFHDVAVMFVDLAGSTPYGEQFGGQMTYYLSDKLEAIQREAVAAHHGAWERIEGDGALFFFERTEDAARCALALQARLERYNRDEAEAPAHQLRVRVGIHHGRCRVVRRNGQWRLFGPVANTAKRVEQAGAGETGPILLSRAAAAELAGASLALRPFGTVQAKGVAEPLELFRLVPGDAPAVAAPARKPLRGSFAAIVLGDDGGRARVARVQVEARPATGGTVRPRRPCSDQVAERAQRAVAAALRAAVAVGLRDARAETLAIEWDIEGQAPIEGASFELALALAAAACLTGTRAPRVLAAGAIEGDKVAPVGGLEGKAELLVQSIGAARRGPFEKLLLPAANRERLPAALRREQFSIENRPFRCVGVATVEEALREALGGALGLPEVALGELVAVRGAAKEPVGLELWVEPEGAPAARDLLPRREGGKTGYRWRVGDKLRVRLRADRDCFLALFNINPLGEVTVLLPNERRPAARARPGEAACFPAAEDDLDYELQPPTGLERLIALATARPLPLAPAELGQDAALICARLTAHELEQLAARHAGDVLGRAEIDFQVEEPPTRGTRGLEEEEEAWSAFDLG